MLRKRLGVQQLHYTLALVHVDPGVVFHLKRLHDERHSSPYFLRAYERQIAREVCATESEDGDEELDLWLCHENTE